MSKHSYWYVRGVRKGETAEMNVTALDAESAFDKFDAVNPTHVVTDIRCLFSFEVEDSTPEEK